MIHHSERGAGYLGDEKYTDTQHAMLTHKNSQNKPIFFIYEEKIKNYTKQTQTKQLIIEN